MNIDPFDRTATIRYRQNVIIIKVVLAFDRCAKLDAPSSSLCTLPAWIQVIQHIGLDNAVCTLACSSLLSMLAW
jgi:hypothetical protein